MDFATITDIKELKALHYDQQVAEQQAQAAQQAINARIAELVAIERQQAKADKA